MEGEADIVNNKTSEAVLVLPYYPKGSLQDELDRRSAASSPFDQRTVLQIFSGVCAGLRVMHYHEPPYAHRDIKPHNVLLEKDYTPVLMDLGSVAVARSNIRQQSIKVFNDVMSREGKNVCFLVFFVIDATFKYFFYIPFFLAILP